MESKYDLRFFFLLCGRTKGAWQIKRGGGGVNDLFTTINADYLIPAMVEGLGGGFKSPTTPHQMTLLSSRRKQP